MIHTTLLMAAFPLFIEAILVFIGLLQSLHYQHTG